MSVRESIYYVISTALAWASRLRPLRVMYRGAISAIDFITPLPQHREKLGVAPALLLAAGVIALAFGVNAVLAATTGRLLPDCDPMTRNLFEDIPNLINYLVICPGYFVFGLYYIFALGRFYFDEHEMISVYDASGQRNRVPRVIMLSVGVFALSSLTVSGYMQEFIGYSRLYWGQAFTPEGVKVLTTAGYYYFILNFVLSVAVMLTVFYILKLFSVSFHLEQTFRRYQGAESLPSGFTEESVKRELAPFASAYVFAKLYLLFIYANIYTWGMNEPAGSRMLGATASAASIGILILVSLPKYHVQYWVHKMMELDGKDTYVDIRTVPQQVVSTLVNVVILGGSAVNLLIKYVPGVAAWFSRVAGQQGVG